MFIYQKGPLQYACIPYISAFRYILQTFYVISLSFFQLLNGGEIVQPLLIAAGGGGSSSAPSPNRSPDAQGLIDPWDTLESWKNHVSTEDKDAGSGGGWNASLTLFANFSVIYPSHNECKNRTQPTGFSAHWSWIGGMPCNPQSNQYGGFGGGGGGCFGGGGGGGFIGKSS